MLAKIINKYKEIKKLKETRTEVVCKCFGLTNYDLEMLSIMVVTE